MIVADSFGHVRCVALQLAQLGCLKLIRLERKVIPFIGWIACFVKKTSSVVHGFFNVGWRVFVEW